MLAPLAPTGDKVASGLLGAVERVRSIGLLGAQVGIAPPAEDRYAGLADLLRQLATFARDQGRLLVIRVDEVRT